MGSENVKAEAGAKILLGQVVATPGAIEALATCGDLPSKYLSRHINCDWGEMPEEDKRANDQALIDGGRLMLAYTTSWGVKLWVITEGVDDDGQRAVTTLLLPSEY